MASRSRIILTGSKLPKIQQPSEAAPSIVNERMISDFTKVVEQTGIPAIRMSPMGTKSRETRYPAPRPTTN
jgi:hypothetical protein